MTALATSDRPVPARAAPPRVPPAEIERLGLALARAARIVRTAEGHHVVHAPRPRGRPRVDAAVEAERLAPETVLTLVQEGWGRIAPDGRLLPSPRALARAGRVEDALRRDKQKRVLVERDEAMIEVDLSESPLRWLAARRDAGGRLFLAAHEVAAGERLRADFTRAGLSPRMGVAWDAPIKGSGAGDRYEFADAVIAGRQRFGRAVVAVGPEFSGLLVDVCCFLKGLEEAEKARHWPARTGKVVLKLALAALARHYGLEGEARGADRAPIRGWTAEAGSAP